jgi:hypothetical protein
MQRAHFHLIADILAAREPSRWGSVAWVSWYHTVRAFADRLAATNGQFKRGRFLDACNLPPEDE